MPKVELQNVSKYTLKCRVRQQIHLKLTGREEYAGGLGASLSGGNAEAKMTKDSEHRFEDMSEGSELLAPGKKTVLSLPGETAHAGLDLWAIIRDDHVELMNNKKIDSSIKKLVINDKDVEVARDNSSSARKRADSARQLEEIERQRQEEERRRQDIRQYELDQAAYETALLRQQLAAATAVPAAPAAPRIVYVQQPTAAPQEEVDARTYAPRKAASSKAGKAEYAWSETGSKYHSALGGPCWARNGPNWTTGTLAQAKQHGRTPCGTSGCNPGN